MNAIGRTKNGFTIVELLIVIVVIAILVAITVILFSGLQDRAKISAVKTELSSFARLLQADQINNNYYPGSIAEANGGKGLKTRDGTTLQYSVDNAGSPQSFCLTAVSGSHAYHVTHTGTVATGPCTGHSGPSQGGGGGGMIVENTGNVTTLAGSIEGYADGQGTSAQFAEPYNVAVDSDGYVYVADWSNHRIRKITPTGNVTTLAGAAIGYIDGSGTGARFSFPMGLAVDSSGVVYVADYNNHKIRRITPAGVVTTLAGSSQGYVDGQGTGARFSYPTSITVDDNGILYVVEGNGLRIRKITQSGAVTTFAAFTHGNADGPPASARLALISSIAVDSSGSLYVTDSPNHRVRKITSSGTVSTLAGSGSGSGGYADGQGGSVQFDYPRGLTVDSMGTVYVNDTNNFRVRKITPTGVTTTLAGTTQGYTDGPGTSAQFGWPVGIAVDASGKLYIGDGSNFRVRKVE